MNLIVQISIIVGLLVALLGIAKIIWQGGRTEQRVTSKLEELETSRRENSERIGRVLDEVSAHVKNESVHVNARLQEHVQNEQREWRASVDRKLDLLLTGKS